MRAIDDFSYGIGYMSIAEASHKIVTYDRHLWS